MANKQKRKLSRRVMVDARGEEVDIEQAVELRFDVLGSDGSVQHTETYRPVTNDAGTRMAALFGAATKFGHIIDSVSQSTSLANAIEVLKEFAAALRSGKWMQRERGGGALNLQALATALVAVAAKAGRQLDLEVVRQKLGADEAYRAKASAAARQVPEMVEAYRAAAGLATVTANELFEI